jgi:hypothetical protein
MRIGFNFSFYCFFAHTSKLTRDAAPVYRGALLAGLLLFALLRLAGGYGNMHPLVAPAGLIFSM